MPGLVYVVLGQEGNSQSCVRASRILGRLPDFNRLLRGCDLFCLSTLPVVTLMPSQEAPQARP